MKFIHCSFESLTLHYTLTAPPAFESIDELSQLSGIRNSAIAAFTSDSSLYYREFSIPKRNGGERKLHAPLPALKTIQNTILKNALDRVVISDACHSYAPNRSIISNAKAHAKSKSICRLDIADFFPSVKQNYVMEIFHSIGFERNLSIVLSLICTLKDGLPQGASTSPSLSNISLIKFDEAMLKIATNEGLTYSRYADDIYLSGNYVSNGMISYSIQALQSYGFAVNKKKTALMTGGRKIVTGLSVSSGSVRVPKGFKRKLRNDAFIASKINTVDDLLKISNDPFYLDRIVGRLEFWKSVEPDNVRAIELSLILKAKMIELSIAT